MSGFRLTILVLKELWLSCTDGPDNARSNTMSSEMKLILVIPLKLHRFLDSLS